MWALAWGQTRGVQRLSLRFRDEPGHARRDPPRQPSTGAMAAIHKNRFHTAAMRDSLRARLCHAP